MFWLRMLMVEPRNFFRIAAGVVGLKVWRVLLVVAPDLAGWWWRKFYEAGVIRVRRYLRTGVIDPDGSSGG